MSTRIPILVDCLPTRLLSRAPIAAGIVLVGALWSTTAFAKVCEVGKVLLTHEGEMCCWPGQTQDELGFCTGTPQCPEGFKKSPYSDDCNPTQKGWHKRHCQAGNGANCYNWAQIVSGLEAKDAPKRAQAIYKRGCLLGDDLACQAALEPPRSIYDGPSSTVQVPDASYEKACREGNFVACGRLATLYKNPAEWAESETSMGKTLEGKLPAADPLKAEKFYGMGCDLGALDQCSLELYLRYARRRKAEGW